MRRPFTTWGGKYGNHVKTGSMSAMMFRIWEIEERVRRIEKQTGMELDEHQMTAVKEAVRNGLLIITGGPGTEKRRRSIRSSSILRWKDLIFFLRRLPDVRRSA